MSSNGNEALSFFGKSSDFLDYCPFTLGMKPSELGLRKVNESEDLSIGKLSNKQFLLDEKSYQLYLDSKQRMREQYPEEDYKNHLSKEEEYSVYSYMAERLSLEYPTRFSFSEDQLNCLGEKISWCRFNGTEFEYKTESIDFRDALDFIAHHIQEDFCLVDVGSLKARLIHLSSPNDWTAKWGIDKDFDEIHVRTPRAFEIVKRPPQIFKRLFQSNFLYERLGAMTLTSYPYLLRHPSHKETPISEEYLNFYFRFERQTLKAIPNSNLILFTIRPFLMDFTDRVQRELTLEQVELMSSRELENRYSWFFEANQEYFKKLFSN